MYMTVDDPDKIMIHVWGSRPKEPHNLHTEKIVKNHMYDCPLAKSWLPKNPTIWIWWIHGMKPDRSTFHRSICITQHLSVLPMPLIGLHECSMFSNTWARHTFKFKFRVDVMEYSVLCSCVIDCVTRAWSNEFTVKVPRHFRFRNTSERTTDRIVISIVCDIDGRLWRWHQLRNIYKTNSSVYDTVCGAMYNNNLVVSSMILMRRSQLFCVTRANC